LYDGLNDPLLKPALEAFILDQRSFALDSLVAAVRLPERNFMKEARLAGMVEVYETVLGELRMFAEAQLKNASQ
jgi:hypothetical protein